MPVRKNSCLSISKNTVSREVDGKLVLMSLETGAFYSFNHTGALIWKLLSDRKTPPEIVAQVAQEFDISDKTARRDVALLLKELEKELLIENA